MKKIVGIAIMIVVLIIGVLAGYHFVKKYNDNRTSISTTSTLSRVLEVSDLDTIEYIYNSVATQKDGDKDAYYVRYDGKVKAGIDFSKVKFDVSENEKTVKVTLPPVVIHSCNATPVDQIIRKSKYETETVFAEMNRLCNDDLEVKAKSNKEIFDRAEDNAKRVIGGLIKPFTEGYTVTYEMNGGEE